MSVLNVLQQDIANKLHVAQDMHDMLCELEWCLEDADGNQRCPVCKGLEEFGHKDGCKLDSTLIGADLNGY